MGNNLELLLRVDDTLRQERYIKNELKNSKRFDHVTDDVMILF